MPKNSSAIDPTEAESVRFLNSRTSSDGCSILDSYQPNSASTARPPSTGPSTPGLTHDTPSPPCTIPKTTSTRPMTEASTPRKSILPGAGLRDSGTRKITANTPAIVTGTLIRKTEPHQKWASSRPPSTCLLYTSDAADDLL